MLIINNYFRNNKFCCKNLQKETNKFGRMGKSQSIPRFRTVSSSCRRHHVCSTTGAHNPSAFNPQKSIIKTLNFT